MSEEVQSIEERAAGFWIRLCAGLVDLILVAGGVVAAKQIALPLDVYVPLELTILLVWPVYTLATHWLLGRTMGKWIYGLAVLTRDGASAGLARIAVRETIGKLLSLISIGVGFLLCVVTKRKRALHDVVAGTRVVTRATRIRTGMRAVATVAVIAVFLIALDAPGLVSIARDALAMRPAVPVAWAYESRDPSALVDAHALDDASLEDGAAWIRLHAVSPIEYAVAKARAHQVVVFGEVHEKKQALDYFNALIPELYHRAGVTKVALEVCLAEDDEALERLVTGDAFDLGLAMEIARHQPWGIWGFDEYWDVLETVWNVNHSLTADQPKMHVVGLDSPMDMASVGMLGLENNPANNCPLWEKLRVVRLPRVLPKVLARDVQMAREIERQILDTGERSVVWVGGQHAWASPQPVSAGGLRATRMGALLRRKHGDEVFFIRLHGFDMSMSWLDTKYTGPEPVIGSKIEAIMARSGQEAAGFDTAPSPMGKYRDGSCFDYHFDPRLGLEDIGDGYVYLAPWSSLTQCTWRAEYLTQEMFTANKPFYQSFGRTKGKQLENAKSVNDFFGEG